MEKITYCFKANNTQDAIKLATKMIKENISFDFLNSVEFFIYIYDTEDYIFKRGVLGVNVINEQNIVK